jgi:hypothetical protein
VEINPLVLSQLPTQIVELFPFMTTQWGPGMHEKMVYQFIHFATKGVMFGTYTNSLNELKRLRYAQQHVSFLDQVSTWPKESLEHFMAISPSLCYLRQPWGVQWYRPVTEPTADVFV